MRVAAINVAGCSSWSPFSNIAVTSPVKQPSSLYPVEISAVGPSHINVSLRFPIDFDRLDGEKLVEEGGAGQDRPIMPPIYIQKI